MSRREKRTAFLGGLLVIGLWAAALLFIRLPGAMQPPVLPTQAALPTGLPDAAPETIPQRPVRLPDAPAEVSGFAENRVIVYFAPDSTQAERNAYVESLGGSISRQIAPLNAAVLTVPHIAPLPASPVIAASEPDYLVSALLDVPTSDPHYAAQWGLSVIGAPDAWLSLPDDVPMVRVAVIDSGICAGHPDLAGRVLEGYDFVDEDGAPQDAFGHGCAVSGVIAAHIDNGEGIAGVAPNAQIMPLRVLDAQGVGTYSDVAAAIVYAADAGAQVINLSLGGPNVSGLLAEAVRYAAQRDVLLVAAAGNTGREGVLYPAAYPEVLAVGSIDPDLQRSSFSTWGPQIGLLAPGRNIMATHHGGGYSAFNGTSMAAPHVSGAAAILMARGEALQPHGGILSLGQGLVAPPTPVPVDVPAPYQPLYARAVQEGAIPVIVGLNATWQPEAQLSSAQAQSQRASIMQVRGAVVAGLSSFNAQVKATSMQWQIPFVAMQVDAEALLYLAQSPDVASIVEDRKLYKQLARSVPHINASLVVQAGYNGAGQAVAILDDGVDAAHSFFGDRVAAEACFSNAFQQSGDRTTCPNNQQSQTGAGAAGISRCLLYDPCNHGTHVAGIAAGNGGHPTFAPRGVAPGASIIAVQVFTGNVDCNPNVSGNQPCVFSWTSDQLDGLQYVLSLSGTYAIAAVNLSLGSDATYSESICVHPPYAAAIDALEAAGIATVIASGNSSDPFAMSFPACLPDAISVGSTGVAGSTGAITNVVSNFSNGATTLDLLAPGGYIVSAIPDNAYAGSGGTSMAAPHVTGAWALLRQANPDATIAQVLAALKNGGVSILDTRSGANISKPRIDVSAALNLLLPPLVVNSADDTNDGMCDATHCSLREAILASNASGNAKDTIRFNIGGGGQQTIVLGTSPLPVITSPVIIDGTTQPGFSSAPLIEIDGGNVTQGDPLLEIGLNIIAGNSVVKGLVINNFGSAAINLSFGGGNVITGNYLGTEPNGTTAAPNREGVRICSSSDNRIGGTTSAERNIISGNSDDGINLCRLAMFSQPTHNVIQGNYIGVTASGSALGNSDDGIKIEDAIHTLIGGTAGGARNIISGNGGNGIRIVGPNSSGHMIQGNFIGTNLNGTSAIANSAGIYIADSSGNLIGGTSAAARNLISGNLRAIVLSGTAANNTIQGNHIGTNLNASASLTGQNQFGIFVGDSAPGPNNNLIGGTASGAGNVISGNQGGGVFVYGDSNIIQGNFIGTNSGATLDLGNGLASGITLIGSNNLVGGTASGAGNVIAYNTDYGVAVGYTPPFEQTGNAILGNRIFNNKNVSATGLGLGIDLQVDGVTANDPGDSDTGANNLQNFPVLTRADATYNTVTIEGTLNSAANTTYRIEYFYNNTCDSSGYGEGQFFLGAQSVTTDGSGNASLSALYAIAMSAGQQITATATDPGNNTSEFSACRAVSLDANVLVVNSSSGARDNVCDAHCTLPDATSVANSLAGAQTIVFNIPGAGPHIIQPAAMIPGGSSMTIDGTTQPGYAGSPLIIVDGSLAPNGSGLTIGSNATVKGLMIRSFKEHGMLVSGANNVIGGPNPGDGNVISGNSLSGIQFDSESADNNLVQGNYIGTTANGMAALPNGQRGVLIRSGADNNVVRGNLISGNTGSGVYVENATTQNNEIRSNTIGLNLTASAALPNGQNGVEVASGTQTAIIANIISGNAGSGIVLSGATSTIIEDNHIGAGWSDSVPGAGRFPVDPFPNGQHGIWVKSGSGTRIGGLSGTLFNVIAFNTLDGVYIEGGSGHTVSGNVIEGNGGLGIDLGANGVTLNDSGDGDSGANGLQNFPIITEVAATIEDVRLKGTLNSSASTVYLLNFYNSNTCDASGYGEGRWHLGTTEISSDGSGNATFNVTLPHVVQSHTFMTVTAADLGTGSTSEFSACAEAILYVATPLNFSVQVLSEIDIELTWTDDSADETHWLVERSLAGQNQWTQIASIPTDDAGGTGAAVEYHDTAFLCSKSYDYRLRAWNQPGGYYSVYTPTQNGSPVCPPLLPPADFVLTPAQRQIDLAWTDSNTTETGYRIEYSANAVQSWALLATVPANRESYSLAGLICGTPHSFRVRAERNHDSVVSAYTADQTVTTTPCPALNAPVSPAASALSRSTVQFTWADGAPGQTSAFHLERSVNGTDWVQLAVVPASVTGVTDANLIEKVKQRRIINGCPENDLKL